MTYNERLSSDDDDDDDRPHRPGPPPLGVPTQQHKFSRRYKPVDALGVLLSTYAKSVMTRRPGGDGPDDDGSDDDNDFLYAYPPKVWSRNLPLGPRATNMNKESPFLKLPLDIRLIIYEYLFDNFTLCEYPLLGWPCNASFSNYEVSCPSR